MFYMENKCRSSSALDQIYGGELLLAFNKKIKIVVKIFRAFLEGRRGRLVHVAKTHCK